MAHSGARAAAAVRPAAAGLSQAGTCCQTPSAQALGDSIIKNKIVLCMLGQAGAGRPEEVTSHKCHTILLPIPSPASIYDPMASPAPLPELVRLRALVGRLAVPLEPPQLQDALAEADCLLPGLEELLQQGDRAEELLRFGQPGELLEAGRFGCTSCWDSLTATPAYAAAADPHTLRRPPGCRGAAECAGTLAGLALPPAPEPAAGLAASTAVLAVACWRAAAACGIARVLLGGISQQGMADRLGHTSAYRLACGCIGLLTGRAIDAACMLQRHAAQRLGPEAQLHAANTLAALMASLLGAAWAAIPFPKH